MLLKPHQPLDAVPLGETLGLLFSMLRNAADKVRGHASIERAVGGSGENIDTGLPLHRPNKEQGGCRIKSGMTMCLGHIGRTDSA